jgi:hypothetical protein
MNNGLLPQSPDQWIRSYTRMLLSADDAEARAVPCRHEADRTPCGAQAGEPCWSVTGLMASGPHAIRSADARAAATGRAA